MQTSFKAFWTRWPFPANFRLRNKPLTQEDHDPSGLGVAHAFSISFGNSWRASVDSKLITSIFAGVILYLLAAFLANEWLYLLSCAMFVVAVLGAILPFLIISTIAVDCWLPDNGIAADDAFISVVIRHVRWIGSGRYLVPINALRARIILARREVTGFQANKDLSEQSIWLDSAGQGTTLSLSVPRLQRGVFKMSHVTVCSAFPFGLVWWSRKITPAKSVHHADTIVVYPRTCSMRGNFLLQIKGMLSTMGMAFSEVLAFTQSTSVRGLREFRVGDSLRHIHWPSSAKQSKLLVRQFDSETLPIFDLYLDLTANWQNREQFELAVCLAHSLVHFGYDRDILPELYLRPALGSAELETLMQDLPLARPPIEMLSEILARVEPISRNLPVPEIQTNRQLLALVPSTERLLRSQKSGDQVTSPVNLVSVFTAEGHELSTAKITGDIVATIYSEDDLEAL